MIRSTAHPLLPAAAGSLLTAALMAGCSAPAPESTSAPSPSVVEPSASPEASASPSPSADAEADVAAARESLAASIASGNTAALASWVTDPVQVTIAASEFSEPLSPFEAAAQAEYVVDLAATWDFALPEATIDLYRAGFYTAYFPEDVLVGRSSTGAVVAFTMSGAEASAIFMCIDEGLLF